ncbi:MAG: lipoyl protein ligase domain-containing protein, partial [Candidatus Binatia bacterium]
MNRPPRERADRWQYLGAMPYAAAMDLQRRLFAERAGERRPDTLLLLEHPPTITLGRRASDADVRWTAEALARSGTSLFRVGRGGAATFHGPGQLVGYPIV